MSIYSALVRDIRDRLNLGEYPDKAGCDLCAGVPLAPDVQSCDHRCTCGRQLVCEHQVDSHVYAYHEAFGGY